MTLDDAGRREPPGSGPRRAYVGSRGAASKLMRSIPARTVGYECSQEAMSVAPMMPGTSTGQMTSKCRNQNGLWLLP